MLDSRAMNEIKNEIKSEDLKELPAVARNISLMCKKCGVERFHVVLAHTNSTTAKVQCEVCKAKKTFKLSAPKKAKVAKKPGTGAKKSVKKVDLAAEWSKMKDQIGLDKLQPYNMRTKFSNAAAIEHPKFGIGFISLVTNEKIDVTFQEQRISLVHNRA